MRKKKRMRTDWVSSKLVPPSKAGTPYSYMSTQVGPHCPGPGFPGGEAGHTPSVVSPRTLLPLRRPQVVWPWLPRKFFDDSWTTWLPPRDVPLLLSASAPITLARGGSADWSLIGRGRQRAKGHCHPVGQGEDTGSPRNRRRTRGSDPF